MKNPIQISIPTPCHEKWDKMTPIDKGRFCASCQKNVWDFTRSSDREIAAAFAKEANLCGQFLPSQLDRELYIPKKKNTIWIKTGIVAVNILSLFSQQAFAQAVQRQNIITVKRLFPRHDHSVKMVTYRTVNGAIGDAQDSLSLEGVKILNKKTLDSTITDSTGKFTITATLGDPIEIQFNGYNSQNIIFQGNNLTTVLLQKEIPISFINSLECTIGTIQIQRRTFFGRVFHFIGNLFR